MSDRQVIAIAKERFKDALCVHFFRNVCFVFGHIQKGSKAYEQGEYGFVACYRRYKHHGKENLRWTSSWILDRAECKVMLQGFSKINGVTK